MAIGKIILVQILTLFKIYNVFIINDLFSEKKMQLHAVIGCLMPIIFTGSVHLRGGYLQTMSIEVAIKGNNRTKSIMFCLGVTNNINSCVWFLMRLNEALRDAKQVLFITNIDDIITSFLGQVFPDSYHGYYCKTHY